MHGTLITKVRKKEADNKKEFKNDNTEFLEEREEMRITGVGELMEWDDIKQNNGRYTLEN